MSTAAFKGRKGGKKNRTLRTPSTDTKHMPKHCSRARPSLIQFQLFMCKRRPYRKIYDDISWVKNQLCPDPVVHRATQRHPAVQAVTNTTNWSLYCYSVWSDTMKRGNHPKSSQFGVMELTFWDTYPDFFRHLFRLTPPPSAQAALVQRPKDSESGINEGTELLMFCTRLFKGH